MSSSRTRVPAASGPTQFAHPTPGWSYPGTAPGPAEARNKSAAPPPTYKPAPPRGTVEYEMGPGGGIGITQIVSLTQSQYDAIVTKDAATLYVIVEG